MRNIFIILSLLTVSICKAQIGVSPGIIYVNSTPTPPPFVPTDTADCILWLAADSITGLSDGDPVSTWRDLSGNSNDATQSGGNRPTWQTNELNGKPVVDFVYASSQFMSLTTPISVTQDLSIFLVYQKASGSVASILSAATVDANGYPSIYELADNNSYFGFNGNNISWALTNANGMYVQVSVQSISGLDSVWRNGTNLTVSTVAVASGTNSIAQVGRIGGTGQYTQGQIVEIVIYNRKLTTVGRQTVEQYLIDKYNL